MAKVNLGMKAFGLGLVMLSSSAMAAEFDGLYDLEHMRVGGAADICVAAEGDETCYFADISLRLEDGQVTEQAMVELANNTLDSIEANSEKDIPERVEELIYEAVEHLFLEVGDQLNEALLALPASMSIYQFPFAPDVISVELVDATGQKIPAFGNIDLDTGHYDILGIMKGQIDKDHSKEGHGAIGLPIDQAIDKADVSVSLRGSVFSEYESWVHGDAPPPPPEEPPVEEPPADEPPPEEPPADEPPPEEPPAEEPPAEEPPPEEPPADEPPAEDPPADGDRFGANAELETTTELEGGDYWGANFDRPFQGY